MFLNMYLNPLLTPPPSISTNIIYLNVFLHKLGVLRPI